MNRSTPGPRPPPPPRAGSRPRPPLASRRRDHDAPEAEQAPQQAVDDGRRRECQPGRQGGVRRAGHHHQLGPAPMPARKGTRSTASRSAGARRRRRRRGRCWPTPRPARGSASAWPPRRRARSPATNAVTPPAATAGSPLTSGGRGLEGARTGDVGHRGEVGVDAPAAAGGRPWPGPRPRRQRPAGSPSAGGRCARRTGDAGDDAALLVGGDDGGEGDRGGDRRRLGGLTVGRGLGLGGQVAR